MSATFFATSCLHQGLERRRRLVQVGDRLLAAALARAHIRLLVGDEVGGREEPVLEVVDAQGRGLGVGHRTQVPGHLQAALVRFLDHGAPSWAREICM